MKQALCAAIMFLAPLLLGEASAATLKQIGVKLLVTGDILPQDFDGTKFEGIKEVVFERSLGGSVAGAKAYVAFIKANRLDTTVKGKCYSACAIAFLGGANRTADLSDGGLSALSLHAARIQRNGVTRPASFNNELVAYINELTGKRLTPQVLNLIRQSWAEAAAVIFIFQRGPKGTMYATVYCDGSQGADISKCRSLSDADPVKLGILTTASR